MRLFILLLISTVALAQQTRSVDFQTMNASLEINPLKRNVRGSVRFTFQVKAKIDTIRIDAQKMVFSQVMINAKAVSFKENKKQLLLFEGFRPGMNELSFTYEAFPTQTMYFVNWDFTRTINTPEEVQGQIWTQGQGKYTSHWLPSFDDVNEKLVFGLDIRFHRSFEVISNGDLVEKEIKGDDFVWHYQMKKPMSSYLVMLAIGHFQKRERRSKSGVPLFEYYEKGDENRVEPTYRYSTQIFDYLEKEIGFDYPWRIYRQVPVHDFLYAGMENTTATVFSRDFLIDSIGFNDRNYVNVNAHELAHQWFGNLVTARSGREHWLQEGFATYYALLAERHIFGEDYFQYKLYLMSRQLLEASKKDTIPVRHEKASSLSYYQKGAWALHVLREQIGREKFNLVVKRYLKKYQFGTVSTEDFLRELQLVCSYDVESFRKRWLESAVFQEEEVNAILVKNPFVKKYMEVKDQPLNFSRLNGEYIQLMKGEAYFPIKQLLLQKTADLPFEYRTTLLEAAMSTKNWEVRQEVANTVINIPESFRLVYESLLEDPSYDTKETALYHLWKQFPERRNIYLKISENWEGFEDKSLRLMHLYLTYLTESEPERKEEVYLKLLQYTGTNYDSNVQQEALQKLLSLEIYTADVLRSLAYGAAHHRWQFVKFCKDNIRALMEDDINVKVFESMLPHLPIRERTHLQRLLNEKEKPKK